MRAPARPRSVEHCIWRVDPHGSAEVALLRGGAWARACLFRYNAARLKPASRHARTQLTPSAYWNHWTVARRRVGVTRLFGAPPPACACRA